LFARAIPKLNAIIDVLEEEVSNFMRNCFEVNLEWVQQ